MTRTTRSLIAPLLAAALALPCAASSARAAETAEAVEKDLAAVFQRMDAMKGELDRIEELAAAPKATILRVEIMTDETAPVAPVNTRFIVDGKLEDEREWSKVERESFSDRHVPMPLVYVVPYLPGNYPARLEVTNPAWKTPPAFEFQASLRKGETTLLKLRLGGKGAQPALTKAPDAPPQTKTPAAQGAPAKAPAPGKPQGK
jgi:hypothetical protein